MSSLPRKLQYLSLFFWTWCTHWLELGTWSDFENCVGMEGALYILVFLSLSLSKPHTE
ncbi:hypothetical protein QUC31_018285 [Theobroma cacao]